LKDEAEILTAEDTEGGHEGQIIPLEVGSDVHHIIEVNEELMDEMRCRLLETLHIGTGYGSVFEEQTKGLRVSDRKMGDR
jgi:hypothetical protein